MSLGHPGRRKCATFNSVAGTLPALERFIGSEPLAQLIRRARDEDLGPEHLDLTSQAIVPPGTTGTASLVAREAGILCGAALLPVAVGVYDRRLQLARLVRDADAVSTGQVVATLSGSMRSILALERVALNLISHLSGIATLTGRYVEQVAGSGTCICDTRKTVPLMRALEKYAVACGGGLNHRIGLHDAVLIKDNHLASLRPADSTASLSDAVQRLRSSPQRPRFIEVEVDSISQLQAILHCGVDLVMLDNMGPAQLARAVALRNAEAAGLMLEASGGIGLDNVRSIAQTGVNFISVGALTHSAPALDLALEVEC